MFGISWLDATDDDFTCSEECNHLDDPDPTCTPTEQAAATKHCSPLTDNNGRFKVNSSAADQKGGFLEGSDSLKDGSEIRTIAKIRGPKVKTEGPKA